MVAPLQIKHPPMLTACTNQYIQLFLKQTCLRPSCGQNCQYRGRDKRPGDFTIADFKGLATIFPDLLGTKRNYSTIVANSEKALNLIPQLHNHMEMRPVSIDDIIRFNPLFDRHTWFSEDRDKFFDEFVKDEYGTIAKYTKPYQIATMSVKKRIFGVLPNSLIRFLTRKLAK